MLLVAPVREERRVADRPPTPLRTMRDDPDLRHRVNVVRSEIPAVTHVDYSARLQTVDEDRNPRFHRLLEAFERLTGCPVLVNTSFNVRGEPIVCTPEDAYRCFLATDMDVLVLEDVVIVKDDAARAGRRRRPGRSTWPSSSSIDEPTRATPSHACNGPTSSSTRRPRRSGSSPASGWSSSAAWPPGSGSAAGTPAWRSVLAALALTVGLLGLVRPRLLRPIYVGLDGPGLPDRLDGLAADRSALMFYGLFTPIGLVFRLIGRDPLHRARRPGPGDVLDSQADPRRPAALLQAVLIVTSGAWQWPWLSSLRSYCR